jgi:hypothetical protein
MPPGHGSALKGVLEYGQPRLNAGQEAWSDVIVRIAAGVAMWLLEKEINPETMVVRAVIDPVAVTVKMSERPAGMC